MTGFGEARLQDQRWSIQVEVRTVNNRHLKLNAKISDEFAAAGGRPRAPGPRAGEAGHGPGHLRIERPRRPEDYRLNLVALASYRDQLRRCCEGDRCGGREPAIELAPLLALPGVVEEVRPTADDRTRTGRDRPRRRAGARGPGGLAGAERAGRWPRS